MSPRSSGGSSFGWCWQAGGQAGAPARERRMINTYSTSEISTCLVDSRLRASHETTGTSDETASASRTSSALWYCTPSKQLIATRYGSLRCSKKSMAAKQSASRLVSTSTTAPIAPRTSSSHMNQNRVLPGICRVSSTPMPADVMIASVVSGVISDTEPTSVVLPTPKPPAMTIFADVTRPDGRRVMSEPPKSTEHPFQQLCAHSVVFVQRGRFVDRDEPVGRHVGDEHARHAERKLHPRGDLRQRLQPAVAEVRDVQLLLPVRVGPVACGAPPHRGLDQRLDRYIQPRTGAASGDGVWPDQRTCWFVAFGHRRRSPPHSSAPP